MSDDATQKHRRQRLADLLGHEMFGGSKAQLGRAMGYQSGAFVRQLLAEERPITEKTVAIIESMQGGKFKDWFSAATSTPAAREPEHMPINQPTLEPRLAHFILDFAMLTPRRQSELIDLVHQEAEQVREIIAQHEARQRSLVLTRENGIKTPAAAAQRPKRARATVAIRLGDGDPRQGALPLTTVADPFTAEPDQRERELYERIAGHERHPK